MDSVYTHTEMIVRFIYRVYPFYFVYIPFSAQLCTFACLTDGICFFGEISSIFTPFRVFCLTFSIEDLSVTCVVFIYCFMTKFVFIMLTPLQPSFQGQTKKFVVSL